DTENLLEFSRLSYCSIIKDLLSFFVVPLATAILEYHIYFSVSTTFFIFYKFFLRIYKNGEGGI
ncbi:hypothetical protein AALG99_14840, partial [Anaerostipes hominis (ex Lee et al. 2021)]